MKRIFLLLLIACPYVGYAQIKVRSVTEVDVNAIAYPNLTGNTTSSMPHPGRVTLKDGSSIHGKITFFKKKGEFSRVKVKTEDDKKEIEAAQIASVALDPIIRETQHPNNFKNPEKNFQTGYIVLPNGVKLTGKVAQVRDFSDYDFFIYTVLFLPDGGNEASSFKGGRLSEFGQQIDGATRVWDGYADGYLIRMVDGRYRLSRNPYSKTKNEFFTSLKNQVADSLAKSAAQAAFMQSIKNGGNLNESIENAGNSAAAVGEVLGNIQINKKEYLIFDTRMNTVTAVNKDSFPDYVSKMSSGCAVKPAASWDKIEEFVVFLNANCN